LGPCMLCSFRTNSEVVLVTALRLCEVCGCEHRTRLEEREAVVAEARKKVEAAEREARELEAEQERQVWCPGTVPALGPTARD